MLPETSSQWKEIFCLLVSTRPYSMPPMLSLIWTDPFPSLCVIRPPLNSAPDPSRATLIKHKVVNMFSIQLPSQTLWPKSPLHVPTSFVLSYLGHFNRVLARGRTQPTLSHPLWDRTGLSMSFSQHCIKETWQNDEYTPSDVQRINSFIHSFINKCFFERGLLCARHLCCCWEYSHEPKGPSPRFHKNYTLVWS